MSKIIMGYNTYLGNGPVNIGYVTVPHSRKDMGSKHLARVVGHIISILCLTSALQKITFFKQQLIGKYKSHHAYSHLNPSFNLRDFLCDGIKVWI